VKNSVSKKHHLIFGGHLAVQCLRCWQRSLHGF
jgi:hypothetical protein